jgi:hypothetical protein
MTGAGYLKTRTQRPDMLPACWARGTARRNGFVGKPSVTIPIHNLARLDGNVDPPKSAGSDRARPAACPDPPGVNGVLPPSRRCQFAHFNRIGPYVFASRARTPHEWRWDLDPRTGTSTKNPMAFPPRSSEEEPIRDRSATNPHTREPRRKPLPEKGASRNTESIASVPLDRHRDELPDTANRSR